MNIIVVGYGKVGQELVRELNEEGNNVTVIDLLQSKVTDAVNHFDVMGLCGNGATHDVQQQAGISRADVLIAVTGSDELNLLCCLIAKKAGNCHTIARVRRPEYYNEAPYLKEELGLAMVINPEMAAAEEIMRVLRFPSAIKIDTFAKGNVELIKFRLPDDCPLVDLSVKEIVSKLRCDVLVCTVERGDDAYIANGNFIFKENDVVSIIASPKNANAFFKRIDYKTNAARDVMVVGGGEISHYLCDMLEKDGVPVKLLEKDEKRCEQLSESLSGVIVINRDASSQEVLLEEGIRSVDAFAAMTSIDEENILLSLFARTVNDGKIITKINRIDFDDVVKHLDLDTVIYPKSITSDTIVRYVRAMKNTIGSNVETLYNVIKGKVEASEFKVREKTRIVGVPLMELDFKPNVLIATIIRGRKPIIPRGADTIEVGDSVIVVSSQLALHDLTDILE